jgi:hypothetical protein
MSHSRLLRAAVAAFPAVFLAHDVGEALRFSPGAPSALVLGLPYCLLTLRALRRAGLATPRELLPALVLGAALMPAAAVTLRLGARLAGGHAGRPAATS